MKRKQKYSVMIIHKAEIRIDVVAENRNEAALCALTAFHSGAQLENDFENLDPEVGKVTCLGIARDEENATETN